MADGRRLVRITPTVAAAALLAACVPLAPPPYATPSPVEVDASGGASDDGFTPAERVSLRVWATTCNAYRNGTAWMLDETHAVTNRHVVEGTTVVELTDYRGTVFHGSSAAYSETDDLAIVTIDGSFPDAAAVAEAEPVVGEPLTVTGYALGGPLATLTGPYVGLRDNQLDPGGAQVYFIEVPAREGNSGSPVTDADGEVVGVVFSSDGEDFAGAVTLERLRAFLRDDAERTAVDTSCG
ncbi:serine protease [Demequina sp.]|uniref:S1 family peptidase n=1 Tax=Demequina sp. TaxID=2050685 RepID=UPI0025FB8C1F|nr:serine protease [Demequina sp.]